MDSHEHRLLHKIDKKLDCVLVDLELMAEGIQAAGDPAKIQAITTKLKQSAAALKAALDTADETTKGY